MKLKSFSIFINENSDLDWSDKNWGEAGMEGENPPNSGLEGTSAEPMDYTAGDYGETSEEDVILDDEIESNGDGLDLENIKALITDLSERISKIEKYKK
jgi:hypothetical protein